MSGSVNMETRVSTLEGKVEKHEERLDSHDIEFARKEERDNAIVKQQKWMIGLLSGILITLITASMAALF